MSQIDDLHELVEQIQSQEDFASFLNAFVKAFREEREEWGENDDLESYLQALCPIARSIQNAYANWEREYPKQPTWRLFAEILLAARDYE